MKILYVITKSNWGGAAKNVYDLALEMKEKGHTAVVALGGDGLLRRKLEDAGIKTHSISEMGRDISVKNDFSSFRAIWQIIKRERPDVLHVHSPKAAGLGALAGRLSGVKNIVFTVHGWTFNENIPVHKRAAIWFFSWLTTILVHHIVLIDHADFNQTLYFPWVKEKVILIYSGLKQPVFMSIDGSRQFISKAAGIEAGEFGKKIVLGTIAELHKNKGLDILLEAMATVIVTHPNTLCVIFGEGEERASLEKIIEEKKLEKHVKLLGYVDEASHYLKGLNMFILPSLKEGLPYVLLEAGYATLPVISTTVGGIPDIIEDMKSGVLIQAQNNRELSHAIAFMIEHPQMRRQYGSALRESVIQKFSIEKMSAHMEKLYSHSEDKKTTNSR